MARSRPKLTFNIVDDSFVLPAEFLIFNLNKPVGACWAPDLHILAKQNEVEQGYMSVDGIQEWYGRILTLSTQVSGVSVTDASLTSIVLHGATSVGTTLGGAIGLLNGSFGTAYTIPVAGPSGTTLSMTTTNKFRPNWWAVHNFLQYGTRCIVGFSGKGFTGTNGHGGSAGFVNSLNSVSDFAIPGLYSIIFQSFHSDTGATSDGGWDGGITWVQGPDNNNVHTLTNALKSSEFPVIGIVNVGITANASVAANIGTHTSSDEYIIAVAGDKYHLNSVSTDNAASMIRTHLAPDVAGLISNVQAPWISPAGASRGRILNTVKLAYKFTTTAQDALYEANVNPVILVPGTGVQLHGDITNADDDSNLLAINVIRTIIYIKTALLPIAADALFEINNLNTRESFTIRARNFLSKIQASGGLTTYTVVCNESNNPQDLIDSRIFAADVKVKIPGSINYINITLTNQ